MGDHIIVGFAPLPPVVFVRFTLGVCLKSHNLGQNKWKTRSPPQIKDGKMARFCPSRGFILDLGGMGVCCSILFCPRLQVTVSWLTGLVCWPGDTSGAPNDNFWKISVRKTI